MPRKKTGSKKAAGTTGGRPAEPDPASPAPRSRRVARAGSVPAIRRRRKTVGASTGKARARRPANLRVVGIGASAGGLEALQKMLAKLPQQTGMGYVIVQHMDPKGSMLTEILQRSATIPVLQAEDGMRVGPDKAYVIPPNQSLRIAKGILKLETPLEGRRPHMTVDSFFRSLAEDKKALAIGVVLSGTGSDGSEGIRAIKAEGGIIFAQDEESAKYPGMPKSAVLTGCVDAVLPPEKIARELGQIVTHPLAEVIARPDSVRKEAPETVLAKIFLLLRQDTGVDFGGYKQAMLERRIFRRMIIRRIATLREYVLVLRKEPEERASLFQDFMINVTSFFREPEAFEALKKDIIPRLLRERASAHTPVRVWVPGCSSGEEVFSLAICFLEVLANRTVSPPLQIFATDIDESALDTARTGIYPDKVQQDVSPARLQRFFVRTEQGYQINKVIRGMCVFARQNVAQDPPFSRMDLISCRNLLIYMKPQTQKRIVPFFHYALNPDGVLFLGESEAIGEHGDLFDLADRKHKFYTKRLTAVRPSFDFGIRAARAQEVEAKKTKERTFDFDVLEKEANRIVLGRYAPAGVLVNDRMEILQFRGDTEPYLAPIPGPATFDIVRMARGGLGGEIRRAVLRAKREKKSARLEGQYLSFGGRRREFALEVHPLPSPAGEPTHFLILFDPLVERVADRTRKGGRAREADKDGNPEYTRELQRELQETKEYLESVIAEYRVSNEELRSANEEIQSSNEELQSTNEELETAKEELQSTNEELTTLNEELENRNLELASTNNDLNNFIVNTQIPVVMVNSENRIRRFTPRSEKILKLIASDIGRPISDVNLNMRLDNLEGLLRRVGESLESIVEIVQDREGRWYKMTIRPYGTADQRIDGAVISFAEMDVSKDSAEIRRSAYRFGAEAITVSREPQVLLSGDHQVIFANRSFYDLFRLDPQDAVGRPLSALCRGKWCAPALRTLLSETLPKEPACENVAVEYKFPVVGRKKLLVNARRIDGTRSFPEAVVLLFHEVRDS